MAHWVDVRHGLLSAWELMPSRYAHRHPQHRCPVCQNRVPSTKGRPASRSWRELGLTGCPWLPAGANRADQRHRSRRSMSRFPPSRLYPAAATSSMGVLLV